MTLVWGVEPRVILCTGNDTISDAVLASAAALSVGVEVVSTPAEAVESWSAASAVLVGADLAEAVTRAGVRPRAGVVVVGFDAGEVARWSVPLGGQVIVLPAGAAALAAVLSDDRGTGGPVVSVIGGSGGVGASTLAAGLAMSVRRKGKSVALVDLDPLGGGIDLLLGAERTPGWRWSRLVGARGEVNDVRRFLPQVDGLRVVSMGRPGAGEPPGELPGAESVRAVLGSLARHHDLVVLDPGRSPLEAARPALAGARCTLVLTGSGVRSVASTVGLLRATELAEPRLVVRLSATSRVPADVIARAVGLSVAGVLPDDRQLARLAEEGEPPGRGGRRRWQRVVDSLATGLLEVRRAA